MARLLLTAGVSVALAGLAAAYPIAAYVEGGEASTGTGGVLVVVAAALGVLGDGAHFGDRRGAAMNQADRTHGPLAPRGATDALSDGPRRPPRPATGDDLDEVIDLIIAQQTIVDRNIPSLGDARDGVVAEMQDLEPPWNETLRLVSGDDDEVVGAVLADWDIDAGRSWVHGPWVAVDDDRWTSIGTDLVDAAMSQLPTAITNTVMTAVVQHRRMAELAERLGWSASEPNHVLIVDEPVVSAWPAPTHPDGARPMIDEDVAAVRALHDVEFPDTYYTANELAARAVRGDQIVLVANGPHGGGLDGYVAGQIQPDGDGYIDFLAVAPTARRTGLGRELVTALCRQLVPESTTRRVCLTVQNRRSPAMRLYESLGFRYDVSIIGYEAPMSQTDEPGTSEHPPT